MVHQEILVHKALVDNQVVQELWDLLEFLEMLDFQDPTGLLVLRVLQGNREFLEIKVFLVHQVHLVLRDHLVLVKREKLDLQGRLAHQDLQVLKAHKVSLGHLEVLA